LNGNNAGKELEKSEEAAADKIIGSAMQKHNDGLRVTGLRNTLFNNEKNNNKPSPETPESNNANSLLNKKN
jgi:hypothetical protein